MFSRPLKRSEFPRRFRDRLRLNLNVRKIGTQHHRELFSEFICVSCDRAIPRRNSRLREAIEAKTFDCQCQGCGNMPAARVRQTIIQRYAETDATAASLAVQYDMSVESVRKLLNSEAGCETAAAKRRRLKIQAAIQDLKEVAKMEKEAKTKRIAIFKKHGLDTHKHADIMKLARHTLEQGVGS